MKIVESLLSVALVCLSFIDESQQRGLRLSNKRCQVHNEKWAYRGKTGPNRWGKTYEQCNGQRQSPIAIGQDGAILNNNLGEIEFVNYDKILRPKVALDNNGHTVVVAMKPHEMYITAGWISQSYRLHQLHFHWGKRNNKGSEHVKNRKRYPLEMHLVHYNTKYENFEKASTKPDGFMVLGVWADISSEENIYLDPIISKLSKVHYKGQSTMVKNLNVKNILPTNLERYYHYDGSLTTPPCTENVAWIVFDQVIGVSRSQMMAFRNLSTLKKSESCCCKSCNLCKLVNNFRPLQEGRQIQLSAAF